MSVCVRESGLDEIKDDGRTDGSGEDEKDTESLKPKKVERLT